MKQAGIIIFPACFTYGLEVTAGPSLLFDTMAGVFNHMAGGRWWGTLFFLFMVFAALSTVLGVCENILAMIRELTGWSRPKGCAICSLVLALFCCSRFGWGWDRFVAEANTGRGLKIRPWMKPVFQFFVPCAIAFIYVYGMATFTWR